MRRLKILHILRAPIGGLFRHVQDLAMEQARLGHTVGVLADSSSSNALTERQLEAIAPHLELGIHRLKMSRLPSLSDVKTIRQTHKLVRDLGIDVLHGHGAKGGLYARLGAQRHKPAISQRTPKTNGSEEYANRRASDDSAQDASSLNGSGSAHAPVDPNLSALRIYTPHGGSLHYANKVLLGPIYLGIETILKRFTDGIIFESIYAQRTYLEHIGDSGPQIRVVPNGLKQEDFIEIPAAENAADFIFIGELRRLKGVDVLIKALGKLAPACNARLAIVGDGPDKRKFLDLRDELNLGERVAFLGALPAHEAFGLGRIVVMPSRAESLPYVALEAAAAGKPLIATHVGGVPEIVWGTKMKLVQPGDVDALADAMQGALDNPKQYRDLANELRQVVADRFTVESMAGSILDFYTDVMGTHA